MADFDLTQSGQEIQNILDGAAMQTDLTAETERAEQAEQQLQGNIDAEELRAKAAEEANADDIDVIEGKIPAAASSENQLADKAFVNSSITTATATYRGAYNLVSDLHLTIDATEQQIAAALAGAISTADNNDYCFVQIPTADATPTQIAAIERYKFNGTAWAYEYTLNNSGFTADQWAALNSGITTGLVAKLAALPTNDELTLLLGGKQDVLTFDNVPTEGSNNPVKSGGVKSAIDSEKERAQGAEQANAGNIAQVVAMIPAAASSENQLADKNFVNSSIATNTATYRGAYNEVSDLSLTVDATHEQIGTALAGAISTADNNDYCFVQIPTADATPTQIAAIERYKFNGTAWAYEYTLNNSGFTADQWAAINSGITSGLVAKLAALPTNDELTLLLAGKQPMLTFDNVPTESSTNPVKSGGVYAAIAEEAGTRAAAIAAIVALIPSAASALNQLADKAFVNSSISTATAVFKGTFNVVADLELNYNASQAQIALMLGSKIASADNNDYCFVQIPTSNETPLEIARTDRYKYNGTAWAYEYTLNNSGFTAAQWAAINSGITSLLKDKLIDLPTATELATQLAAKQNALTFDTTPTEGSTNPVTSDGIHAAIQTLQTNIDQERARALAVEQGLQDDYDDLYALYQTLEGGSIIPVAAADWPVSNPQQNVIYRVANSATPTAYSDYMYNGTATLLLATFTFPGIDSEPTPDSTNLATSGGTFDAIMQNGPAFDLSAYNAVGGTLATYADLSAALTALNALPAAYKKGGMSMKFVLSSDNNKYVQARCMAQNFTTDVTQWQGVDEEPVLGSHNLVESGGVADVLSNVSEITKEESVTDTDEYQSWESDDGSEKYVEINKDGIKAKTYRNIDGDVIISSDSNFVDDNEVLEFKSDNDSETYAGIDKNGIKAKSYRDIDGNVIISEDTNSDEDEVLEFKSDDEEEIYATVGKNGIRANAFYKINGEQLDNPSSIKPFKARIIQDSYVYSDEYGSQPRYTFNALQVIRKYNSNYDLLVEFGFNGPNGFYQPLYYELLPNTNRKLSDFPANPSWSRCSEIIGPWMINAVNNPTITGLNFVGGFHGFICDANGVFYNQPGYDSSTGHKYPSGSCDSYHIYADSVEMNLGDEVYANEIRVVSNNFIQGYNTWVFNDKHGRNVLSNQETWVLKGDKMYILQDINALEECVITCHYGIQTVGFNPLVRRASKDGIITWDSSSYVPSPTQTDYGKDVYALIETKSNGNSMISHMDKKGIFNGEYSGNNDAFDRYYGVSNVKQYWNVVEGNTPCNLNQGERTFYSGWVMYSDKLPVPTEW